MVVDEEDESGGGDDGGGVGGACWLSAGGACCAAGAAGGAAVSGVVESSPEVAHAGAAGCEGGLALPSAHADATPAARNSTHAATPDNAKRR
ncbi:MAG: hypothetical protein JO073_12385 [Actinobacteria bacterium]|nr:hypothetical protein [Actinomycetota bacterium]